MSTNDEIDLVLKDLKKLSPSGFAIAFHIKFTTPAFLFQTYPKEWLAVYNQRGLVMQDPIVGWSFANNGTIAWSSLKDQDPAGVLTAAATFDMNYGVAIGVEDSGSRSVAGFARADREFTEDEAKTLHDGVVLLHQMTATAKSVSPEQRDALRRLSISLTHP